MIHSVVLGVYVPGSSPLHRTPPTTKLVLLVLMIVFVTVLPTQPWHTTAVLAFVAVLYMLARIPVGLALRQLAPVVPLIAFLGIFLWWQSGAAEALTTFFGLLSSLAAANLLTLTTTIDTLLGALEKNLAPLNRVGVPVDHVSLAIALTIRLIPLMLQTINEVLEARRARGAGLSLTAFGTPVIIRSVRRAQNIGEALMARGAGD